MKISLIAALAENRVIGRDNRLPWRLPDDMKRFRQRTTGHCVVMGRLTFESLERPLPKRTNIVLSSQPGWKAQGVHVAKDLLAAVSLARETGEENLFVIGGEAVFASFLESANELLLTRVAAELDGDAYFPAFDESNQAPSPWRLIEQIPHPEDERHAHAFCFQDWHRTDSGG